MDQQQLLMLWGKTDRNNPTNIHPVLFHLYDVLYCSLELWSRLPDPLRQRLAAALNMSETDACTLFALLTGLHDLGKAYPNFQNKAQQFVPDLEGMGFDFPQGVNSPPHNYVSVPEVIRLLTEGPLLHFTLAEDLRRTLAFSLGAHHGTFPTTHDVSPRTITSRTLGESPRWLEARNALAGLLLDALPGMQDLQPPQIERVTDRAFAPLFAAFVSIADWFGSSRHFPMQGAQPGAEAYRPLSRGRAQTALKASGWTAPPTAPSPADFSRLFGYLRPGGTVAPNALQRTVIERMQQISGPALWIMEEEMGAGKTEAAFTVFDHARVQGAAHGVYIAMPTQATSNAMHGRLLEFLQKGRNEKDLNLILAHSHALLDEAYSSRIAYGDQITAPVYDETSNETPEESALLIRAWFTAHKQTLLAPYGVGTIDQALLGVLQTRHWFVRLFGLAGKVVVFDEVHAYDAYMNTLLVQLVRWLAEMECTVVLLSATLPQQTRYELAEAYRKGAKGQLEAQEKKPAYPRISVIEKREGSSAFAHGIDKSDQERSDARKAVEVRPTSNDADEVKRALLEAVPGDGCAIVICNTVRHAQDLYRELSKPMEEDGWNCLLFHARTPFCWRKEREDEVLRLFGKDSGDKRTKSRPKTLLVATQVVEQSLDLDADFMASELAPVDLILQRMGRLWRHRRVRTAVEPRFALLFDTNEHGLPILSDWKTIYAEYMLLRSWLELKGRSTIVLPDDIEPLVSAVYDASDPTGLPEAWSAVLSETKKELIQKKTLQRNHAKAVSIPMQRAEDDFMDWLFRMKPTLEDEENPELHEALRAATRDGDPSITVVLCGTDKNGAPLASQPTGAIPSIAAAEMMQFSLPVSNKSLYHLLKTPTSENSPDNWRKEAHLKHTRRLIFQQGACSIGSLQLKLTFEYGLEIGSSVGR